VDKEKEEDELMYEITKRTSRPTLPEPTRLVPIATQEVEEENSKSTET